MIQLSRKTFIAAAIVVTLSGCSSKLNEYSTQTISEQMPSGVLYETEIKTRSYMQQLMDASERDGMHLYFSPNSADRSLDSISDGNIFSVVMSAAAQGQNPIKIVTTSRGKEITINKYSDSSQDSWDKKINISASDYISGKTFFGAPKISFPSSIDGKIGQIARSFDQSLFDASRSHWTLKEFAEYISSEFAVKKSKIFFNYDENNKVLYVNDAPMPMTTSPYRIYELKSTLDSKGIPYSVVTNNAISIEGGFLNWYKAYTILQGLDPFKSQVYYVSTPNGTYSINEGYVQGRSINIEFTGWNKNGMREYILYFDDVIRKITTSKRILVFEENGIQLAVKTY